MQGYQYTGYSQWIVTGGGGATTGTCEAQLSAGYVPISETKRVITHSPPYFIDVDLQPTRCVGATGA